MDSQIPNRDAMHRVSTLFHAEISCRFAIDASLRRGFLFFCTIQMLVDMPAMQ